MMEFNALVKYNIICYFRDIKSVISRLLEVIMLTLILGFALKDNFALGNTSIAKIKIGLVIEDKGKYSGEFMKYIEVSESRERVDIIKFGNIDDAKLQLSEGNIKNIIYLPNNYSENISIGKNGKIKLITEKERNYYDNLAKEIIDCFNKQEELKVIESNSNETNIGKAKSLEVKYVTATEKMPTAMDYYGVTMLVMFILSSSKQGCSTYSRIKKTSLGERQRLAPICKGIDVLASIIAQVISGTFEWILYVGICRAFLGVNYGDNILIFIALCSILSVFSIFFGMIVGKIVGNYGKAQVLLRFFVYISTFLTGGFSGNSLLNSSNILLSKIATMLPNAFGHSILFSYIYSGNKETVINSLLSMAIEVVVLILISVLIEKRRRNGYIKE